MASPLIDIDRLGISFFTRGGEIPAVMDFSCKIMPGQAMGLVGESGCGKSTVALAIMRDLPGLGRITSGAIRFEGRDMGSLSDAELRAIRGSKIAMVYQEPMASLNPTMLVGRQLMEVPLIHDRVSRDEAHRRAIDMVKAVRLPDPDRVMRAYPHQLSGGQQQRVVIAMALLSSPKLLILDEPTTALDVTVEAGIVALVKDLTARTGASTLFISHNLGLILETCDEVTVMYSGEAVETGAVSDVFGAMRHPYTQGLFRSIPMPGTNKIENPLVFPANCRCRTSGRGAATSGRAAHISLKSCVLRPTCRCARSRAQVAIRADASGSRRSIGPNRRSRRCGSSRSISARRSSKSSG
jgi:peptide/nickel transport system ATP-binding protein